MNIDRELRDALSPLGGDPVADAARVLEALPGAPPPPPRPAPPRWLPWGLLAIGLAVGLAAGRMLMPTATPATPSPAAPPRTEPTPADPPPVDTAPKDTPPKPDVPQTTDPDPRRDFNRSMQSLLVMAFGPVSLDEPGVGRQELEEGEWFAALSTQFKTARGRVGIYVPANDARVRLDYDTEARVDVDRVALEFGRLWVDAGGRAAALRVECGRVRCILSDAAAIVRRAPSGIEVLALRGRVDVHTGAADARLTAGNSLVVDPDLTIGAVTAVPFVAPAMSWMTRMLEMQQDPSELEAHVKSVFAAYEQGEFRDAARREILKLGARLVWLLADSIDRQVDRDRAYALDTAHLVARIVDFRSAPNMLQLLLVDDAEVREVIFRAVRDATDTDAGTDESFWATASRQQRREAVDRWRTDLLR